MIHKYYYNDSAFIIDNLIRASTLFKEGYYVIAIWFIERPEWLLKLDNLLNQIFQNPIFCLQVVALTIPELQKRIEKLKSDPDYEDGMENKSYPFRESGVYIEMSKLPHIKLKGS